jgi:hypothetical protein
MVLDMNPSYLLLHICGTHVTLAQPDRPVDYSELKEQFASQLSDKVACVKLTDVWTRSRRCEPSDEERSQVTLPGATSRRSL